MAIIDLDAARERVHRLFQFVQAFNERRNPPVRDVRQHDWVYWLDAVPQHECVAFASSVDELASDSESAASASVEEDPATDNRRLILRCARPVATLAPEPPAALMPWLNQWDDAREPLVASPTLEIEIDGEMLVEEFADSAERVSLFAAYAVEREAWVNEDQLLQQVSALFNKLYELYGRVSGEDDNVEIVLADGLLSWKNGIELFHPLLTTPLALEFDTQEPSFSLYETSGESELYSALLNGIDDIDGELLSQLRSEAADLGLHPLATAETEGFLRSLVVRLAPDGVYDELGGPGQPAMTPHIGRRPVILLRKRVGGLAQAIAAIVAAIDDGALIPDALLQIVGFETTSTIEDPDSPLLRPFVDANADDEILFTLEANPEQLAIARKLERQNGVLVQGPPGTGKTHTIANIIGHLLATGQNVLVTSQTARALKVLKNKVIPELQPLCLSVADTREDDAELKLSIDGIAEKLSFTEETILARDIARFEAERSELIAALDGLRHKLKAARLDEHRPVSVGAESISPIAAAKVVAAGVGRHDWIPGRIVLGQPLPLSIADLVRLYATNIELTPSEEDRIVGDLPDISSLPTPTQFSDLLDRQRSLALSDSDSGSHLWTEAEPAFAAPAALDILREDVVSALSVLENAPLWAIHVIEVSIVGTETALWDGLISDIENFAAERGKSAHLLVTCVPKIASKLGERGPSTYREIASEIGRTGKLPGFIALMTRGDWKMAIEESRVNGDVKPKTQGHFEALAARAALDIKWKTLVRRWNAQVVAINGPSLPEVDDIDAALRLVPMIRLALSWISKRWEPIRFNFDRSGLKWDDVLAEATFELAGTRAIDQIRTLAGDRLNRLLAAELARRQKALIKRELAAIHDNVTGWPRNGLSGDLRKALETHNEQEYGAVYAEIQRLSELAGKVRERYALLARLENVAPSWAVAIRQRLGIHGFATAPLEAEAAWQWAQYDGELERRASVSFSALARSIEDTRSDLKRTTALLVDRRAWLHQHRRTTLDQRGALYGFAEAKKKLGKGTGKRAARLRREQRILMGKARSAVPVWITSINSAVSVFQPGKEVFDVVIIDEASQSDVTSLVALFLGKKVLVVGDNEQVSPSDVGTTVAGMQQLADAFLRDIPQKGLYDGNLSLYTIAEWSFGGSIMLLEHFRSVPDIIRFSNALSYGGKIKPLRETTERSLLPAVVEEHVDGIRTGDVNELEATTIVSLIKACIEDPDYDNKTIGVISMLAESQVQRIQQLLYRVVPPEEIESRRIVVGTAPQFQGDERDVMFLSLVNSLDERARLRDTRAMQQRYNVAASRARDQMWVVHSMDTSALAVEDLRRKLIEHARDPAVLAREATAALARAESPFEEEVINRLSAAGYRLKSNVVVGGYRIDIVVYGQDRRALAIECDGEQFHGETELEYHMQRQANLERVGWRFVRIRGSAFYRNRDSAMESVFQSLRAVGIEPLEGPSDVQDGVAAPRIAALRSRAADIRAEIYEALDSGDLLLQPRGRRRTRMSGAPDAGLMESRSVEQEGTADPRSSRSFGNRIGHASDENGEVTALALVLPVFDQRASIEEYTPRELRNLAESLVSIERFTSAEDLARAVSRHLGFTRFGSRISNRLVPLARQILKRKEN